ncbi:CLL_collapsed_G0011460.mRNA.1.CDS.1 [Saccharomyces cerevisiae]|uniref:K7_Oms1p n=1 Tax=Saccharomyces cerevisiae (strain Kyokai no. 7 / NBRC 101557) TaxID=721032 RepID=G2WB54_YEASK|nr:K7_Oms1p [Saccharomyces cerevisiae Kyokai no. 7]CAI5240580.1 CLL_HP2_G0010460.mRNA.1.CDS.1 [Saccharomyces cerevisiae]CAI6410149.1 CLL_HP2_G0010460.mRNA.1.CDS.1 [Saccharomyces cerevisiae]CAI6442117.1 CLL_HP1_G0011220.mRNA.1.CDS.1 [Saccharomyces cerevisiae]CAI7214361.1 CLL_collapsed_G0011460.mRNA.1.CDS.1 [Saccharomyces cerevisiae]
MIVFRRFPTCLLHHIRQPVSRSLLLESQRRSLSFTSYKYNSSHIDDDKSKKKLKNVFQMNSNRVIRKQKTKEELAKEGFEEQLRSPNRFVRWGAIARSEKFSKGMTKYMIGAYVIFLIYGLFFTKKLFAKDKELERLLKKQEEGNANEYEALRIKELKGKLRRRDELKLEEYKKMQEEGIENFDDIRVQNFDQNKLNEQILPARDTTNFYQEKANEYDKAINMEERVIFLGKRRKWLMKHCQGDVLEVSCGTGRNIKYLDMSRINSITFLDSSENMMEITHKKFREKFPKYKKVAFVVGKAENLVDLAEKGKPSLENEKENQVKYDTIVEAFGLCSHEDPVKALNNFGKLLKPDGRIILLEHGRGQYDFINKILDNRAERRLNTWGCRWNLDLGEVLDDSDLELVEEKRTHLGTTWCIVAKRKGDVKKKDELGFVEKYLQSSIRKRMESFEKKDDMASKKELEPVPPVSKS